MKRILAAFIVVLMVASLSLAESQPSSKFQVSIGGGFDIPVGYFDDQYKMGLDIMLGFDYFLHKNVCLFLNTGFDTFQYDKGSLASDVYKDEGGDYSLFSVFAGGKGVLPTRIKLTIYALAGVGLCVQSSSDFKVWGKGSGYSYTQTTYNKFRKGTFLGITAGSGAAYELSELLGLFFEVRVVDVFTTSQGKPDDWPWLPKEVYEDNPNALFFPVRFGVNIKI